jgi:hypothetical protein
MFTPVETGVIKKLAAGIAGTFIVSHKEDAHASACPQALAIICRRVAVSSVRYWTLPGMHCQTRFGHNRRWAHAAERLGDSWIGG